MMKKESALAKVRVIFKDFELGVTGGMPLFRIMPEEITADEDGLCHIASARHTTLVLGLETLAEGFAVLLDKHGRLQNMPPEIFGNPGKLLLIPAENAAVPGWVFPNASLAGNTAYGIMPEAGHRLLAEFTLSPSGSAGGCMYCREVSEPRDFSA